MRRAAKGNNNGAVATDDLRRCAEECYALATEMPQPRLVEEDARAAFQRLVSDRQIRRKGKHREALSAIRRALKVDMQKPANRKGDLPRALGLASRIAKGDRIKHQAIVLMMQRLLTWTVTDPATGTLVFPWPTTHAAATDVVTAFAAADIDARLTTDNVEKVFEERPSKSARPPQTSTRR